LVPQEHAEFEMCMEWGISWREYNETPHEIIMKIKAYAAARSDGTKRATGRKKRKAIFDKMKRS
jgi:hypothetical protein